MAVSANISELLTVDGYILDGYKRAGLIPLEAEIGFDSQWNAKAAHGRRTLNRLIEGLAGEGVLVHFENFDVLDLDTGVGLYELEDYVLNVVDSCSYIPEVNAAEEEETVGETPVTPMSVHQWNQLSAKDAVGTPTKYMLQRNGSTLNLRLWPLPAEDGKLRMRVHRISASNDSGSDNVDLKRHWGTWIVNALAYEFMADSKLPLEERMLVRGDRDQALAKMKLYDTSNEPPDLVFCHTTPWTY
jgi:hypothetical protein